MQKQQEGLCTLGMFTLGTSYGLNENFTIADQS